MKTRVSKCTFFLSHALIIILLSLFKFRSFSTGAHNITQRENDLKLIATYKRHTGYAYNALQGFLVNDFLDFLEELILSPTLTYDQSVCQILGLKIMTTCLVLLRAGGTPMLGLSVVLCRILYKNLT